MTDIKYPPDEGIKRRKIKQIKNQEKYEDGQKEENKRIKKDEIIDEDEDEEKEEEDEYVDYYQKRNVKDKK